MSFIILYCVYNYDQVMKVMMYTNVYNVITLVYYYELSLFIILGMLP